MSEQHRLELLRVTKALDEAEARCEELLSSGTEMNLRAVDEIIRLEAENAKLRERWRDLKEWLVSDEAFWSDIEGEKYILAKMQQLEAPAEGGREE